MKNENGPRRRTIKVKLRQKYRPFLTVIPQKESVKKKRSAKEVQGSEDKSSIVNFYMDMCQREEDLIELMEKNESSNKEPDLRKQKFTRISF